MGLYSDKNRGHPKMKCIEKTACNSGLQAVFYNSLIICT